MILNVVKSKSKVAIRLTDERWRHISKALPEIAVFRQSFLLNIIKSPDCVLKGDKDELFAVCKMSGRKQWLFKRMVLWSKEL